MDTRRCHPRLPNKQNPEAGCDIYRSRERLDYSTAVLQVMYSRRKPVKTVYGKARVARQSDLLWNEAITASPIAKQATRNMILSDEPCQSLADEDRVPTGVVDPVISVSTIASEQGRDSVRILANTDPNSISLTPCGNENKDCKSETGRRSQNREERSRAKSVATEQHADVVKMQDSGDTISPINYPANRLSPPITASTPIRLHSGPRENDLLGSHIRFDSSMPREQPSSPLQHTSYTTLSSTTSESSSDLPGIDTLGVLDDLTDAFGALNTSDGTAQSQVGNSSIANDESLHDLQTLLDLCQQASPESFETYIESVLRHSRIRKLGEASFSEVYLCESTVDGTQTVLKVIPFGEGSEEVPINDIIQEVRISKAMSSIPGFVKLKSQQVVKGRYPAALLEQWDLWKVERTSESDRPDWYLEEQKYCIIALEHGGVDLEHFEIVSWVSARRIFSKIVTVLALGESDREFEHRDLHWGNVLIQEGLDEELERVTIIDYTLSRALVRDQLSELAYYGFADRAIFEAEGDDYQFEIYRLMRDSLTDGNEDEALEDWTQFHPNTNVLWLHYLVDKLLYAKDLKKPAMRITKRNPILDDHEIQAWKSIHSIWNLLNPRRKYRYSELPISSAIDVQKLIQD